MSSTATRVTIRGADPARAGTRASDAARLCCMAVEKIAPRAAIPAAM
jgi:hypothetical protein